jgi:hypothetical protein
LLTFGINLDVDQDYPAARVRLEAIAAKKLEKYKKVPLEKGKPGKLFIKSIS